MNKILDRHWFTVWRDAKEFLIAANNLNFKIDQVELFNKNAWKFVLEATMAGQFAASLEKKYPAQVKLGESQSDPDFLIQTERKIFEFELTEVDRPGRKRGKEYLDVLRGLQSSSKHYDPVEECDLVPKVVEIATKKKASKTYFPQRHLAININLQYCKKRISDNRLREATSSASKKFGSTWLFWGPYLIKTWPRWSTFDRVRSFNS